MIILGIDPGTALTGYSLIELNKAHDLPTIKEVSVVKTLPEMEMHYRLKVLYDAVDKIIKSHKPDIMVVEKLFFNTNVKTALTVGQARGIYLVLAAKHKLDFAEYTALEAKLSLTGYGRSDKKVMQEAIKSYFGLTDVVKPDDANDAIAISLCYIKKALQK